MSVCSCGKRIVRDRAGVLHDTCGTCRERDAAAAARRNGVALEGDVQRSVIRLYETVGATVYEFSEHRTGPSRVPIGVADLYVVQPRLGGFWHETKRRDDRGQLEQQRPDQVAFQRCVERARVPYVLGGVEEARAFLVTAGVLLRM